MAYSEVLAQSCFSFLRGASRPEELVEAAHGLGLRSLVLCDRDGLYGCVRAWVRAKELGQTLHIGAELKLAEFGKGARENLLGSQGKHFLEEGLGTAALLAEGQGGYQSLCQLLTEAHADLPKGMACVERVSLEKNNQGLVLVLPVSLGQAGRQVEPWLPFLSALFFGRGYVAVYRRLDGQDELRTQCALRWSQATGFPIVATARPLYHCGQRKALSDILHCIRKGQVLDEVEGQLSANAQAALLDESQMLQRFAAEPQWVHRTEEVIERLKFSFDELNYQFPCELAHSENADEKLARLTWEGLGRRYPGGVAERILLQVKKELQLIAELDVAPYFLCTWEIVQIARERKILCQGRGSAANSAVCYALGITAVDPARSSLLFERFLSAERAEPPDIDIDFEHERREEVILEIYHRYGRDRAAMVSEVISYRGKSALREVGKVFGLSLEQVGRLSQMLTHWDEASAVEPKRLQEYGFDVQDRRVVQVIEWAQQLRGFPRHLSIHVGGFVLSKAPLNHIAPVEPASMAGRTVIPWDKDDIEALGFFKVDVLALGMLTAIRKALTLIHEGGWLQPQGALLPGVPKQGESFDPLEVVARVPAEDPAVYATVSEADTVGVFQIESRAQMAMLPRLRPQRFYDLVIEVALVRPGPIQGGMVHPYLRRRNGEEGVSVPHPDLWPVLKRTLGVPLFQEQVMQLAIEGAGYTGGEADQLRRDMAAWKKSGRLMRHRDKLLSGFRRKGIATEFGEALFEQIKGFGEYGFPESHAASFALLVYLSAWQKTHFPAHFVCALLNSQPMGFYSPSSLVQDAQRHGVQVRPLCVTQSHWDCTLEEVKQESASAVLRLGFRLLKGVLASSVEKILNARKQRGFRSLEDFRRRVKLRPDELDSLAESGALEALMENRREAAWAVRASEEGPLFDKSVLEEGAVGLSRLSKVEQLMLDYGSTGVSIEDHPLRHLRRQLRSRGALTAEQLNHAPNLTEVCVAGLVRSRQRPGTASGVVFITLEDETGTANVVLFSQVFERFRLVARHASLMLVKGRVERTVTQPRPGEVGRATPVVHLKAEHLQRLDRPGETVRVPSRDFH